MIYYLIFFAAGMPALIYQVAWQRLLTLYFGVDIYSTSVTVSTFMLGLGLGSLVGGRLADRARNPAIWYAVVEAAMGVVGLLSIAIFTAIGQQLAGGSLSTLIAVDFALLLLPTTLMGMTLPLMCRIVIANDAVIGEQLAWLYGANTLGAAAGALLSSYLLVGLLGLDGATQAAAALNIALAGVVYVIARRWTRSPETLAASARPVATAAPSANVLSYRAVLAFSFVSGFTALGYEIVWYRVLGVVLHGTVYVFGTILCFYLAGIALGSLAARRRIDEPGCMERFAKSQLGIAAYTLVLFVLVGYFSGATPLRELIGASFFTTFHPSPELVSGHVDIYSVYSLLDIAVWTVLVLGVPTVLMGYGFTNLMREGARQVGTLGRSLGGMYFANILGSTLGSLMVGFVLIHNLGSEHTMRLLIVAGGAIAASVFVMRRRVAAGSRPLSRAWLPASALVILVTAAFFPGRTVVLRALHYASAPGVEFTATEDRSGVSALRRQHEVIAFEQEKAILGQQRLYIDGSHHGDASATLTADDGVAYALAAHPSPRRVLSIGLGDGQMAATAANWSEVQDLVVVELNSTLAGILEQTSQGAAVLGSSKVDYVVDDGRRWLLANPRETFDVIMMFPLHAAHSFSGGLYSLEFFEILTKHLNPGGVLFARSVDLYSTARTLATVFPHVVRVDRTDYLASNTPVHLRTDRLTGDASQIYSRITADRDTILRHTRDARLNTDLKPNSEFYITYPYANVLQTRFRDETAYRSEQAPIWQVPAAAR